MTRKISFVFVIIQFLFLVVFSYSTHIADAVCNGSINMSTGECIPDTNYTVTSPVNGATGQNPSESAQNPLGAGQNPGEGASTGCPTGQLCNPLKSQSISEFILKIIDVLVVFAVPLIVIYIMYAGFRFVTAQGNPGELEVAKASLLYAIVGGVIVLGAKIIIEVIQGTIQAF